MFPLVGSRSRLTVLCCMSWRFEQERLDETVCMTDTPASMNWFSPTLPSLPLSWSWCAFDRFGTPLAVQCLPPRFLLIWSVDSPRLYSSSSVACFTILFYFIFYTSFLNRLLLLCHVVDHIMSCHVTYGISSELMICLFSL